RTIRGIPTEVRLGAGDGMPEECVVNLDNLRHVPRVLLGDPITTLSGPRMHEVCRALAIATGCNWGRIAPRARAAPAGSTSQPSGRYSPPWKTSGSPSPIARSVTAPVTITWSPAATTSRRLQAIQSRAPSIAGMPSRSLQATPAHLSATGALV